MNLPLCSAGAALLFPFYAEAPFWLTIEPSDTLFIQMFQNLYATAIGMSSYENQNSLLFFTGGKHSPLALAGSTP